MPLALKAIYLSEFHVQQHIFKENLDFVSWRKGEERGKG
jgi:hypothetical protein